MPFKLNKPAYKKGIVLLFISALLSGCQALVLIASTIGSYTYSSEETTGQVIDADTHQPISGAIVVTSWYGTYSAGNSHTSCYHVETARTDNNGFYKMPAWSVKQESDLPAITSKTNFTEAFKGGYIHPYYGKDYISDVPGSSGRGAKNYLVKFKGTNDEYLKYMDSVIGHHLCFGESDGSSKNLYKLRVEAFETKKKLVSPEEKIKLDAMSLDGWLVNPNKPTRQDNEGHIFNVDPADNYSKEELLK
mgnify:CR=1 FL=1